MGRTVGSRDGQRTAARRAFWLKHLHRWHWVSSAICLVGMLLFAVTGITLNHAADIPATPTVTMREGELPEDALAQLRAAAESGDAVPDAIVRWVETTLGARLAGATPEWNDGELYVSLPRPGGDAWLTIDLDAGLAQYERTERGWIAYLNDLHKGRNTGVMWKWFIDVFGVASVVFTLTGLFLLQLHAGGRPATWPMVGLGLVIPVLLALLFIH